ncbi:MAG: capsular exopolysaccharide biosynthesis protein, partial [Acidobacteria bacterium]|nr:capsular exopolysaccharide biosynthesis protein [Acidobacteriota bacterium]
MDLNTSQEVHLSHYWNVIYKRWKVAVSIVIVVMLGTFLASYFSTPLYRSLITIQIERENPNQVTIDDLFGIQGSDQEFLQTQYVLLKSRGLAGRVIDDAKLLNDPDFYGPGINGRTPAEISDIKESMIGALLGGIDVTPVRNTSLVEVSYIAPTPRLARKVAETIGDSFVHMKIEQKLETVRQASEFLTRQIAQVKQELDTTRQTLQQYGESKDIISVNDAGNITVQKLIQLNSELGNAANYRIQKETAYSSLLSSNPESVAAGDPLVMKLTEDEGRLQREYSQKLGVFKPEHPDMVRLRADLEKLRQSRQQAIQAAYSKARDNARMEMGAAQGRESQTRTALEQQKRETLKLNVNAATYTDLRSEVESKQALLERLTKQQNETEVTARLRGSNTSNI